MEQSRPQPTQDEWLQHKATIRRLYIVDKMPLKQLLGEMAKMGLQATKAQLEYKLKQWAFRRNIDKDTWIIIDRRITKRKREGKDTEVIHCGKRLKPSTVEKETNRHRHKTIFAQLGPVFASRPSTSDLNVGISETVQLTQASRTRFLLSEIVALDSELGSMPLGQQPTVSRLAAIIGKSMPESFPEEHLHSAQLLLAGSSEESLHEGWKMLIYNLSNDLTDLREAMVWNTTMQMLEEHRIFNLQVDLRNPQDKTIQGLMDTLFSAAIHWTTNNYSNNKINYDKALNLVKWLLSSGYDANSRSYYQVRAVGTQVPLMAAVLSGNVDLMQHLLDKGADANLTSLLQGGGGDEYCDEHWGLPMHPVTVAMMPGWVADWVDRINPEISLRMVKILLRYTNTANLTRAFHISISQAVSELLRSGYEPDIFTWTVIACRNNLEMVKLLIENNKRPPSIFTNFPVWSSPDDSCHPLIGAMQTGNKELLLLLLDASPKIHQHKEENPPFPTLLQCAVQRGYLDAVEYLIKAGADVNEYNLYISGSRSPVQFAVELGRLDILDYLVKAGADINQHRQQDEECLTPLQCAVQLGRLDIVKYLVEAKADIDEHNLQIWGSQSPLQCAVEEGHLDIFHCLVEAGANVNSPPALERGGTALQFAAIKGHLGLARKLLGLGAHVDAPGFYFAMEL
ncbi:hypothetical protein ACO1O0_003072 [Amphichorda felina]